MMRGDGDVVAGWKNKLQTAVASVTPSGVLAEQHRKMAEPGTAKTRARPDDESERPRKNREGSDGGGAVDWAPSWAR